MDYQKEQIVAFLDDWLGCRALQRMIPGFSVALIHGDELLYVRAFGHANILQQERFTTEHIGGVGSQSKMMTAVLIMQLAAQGKLKLHDRVSLYVPWVDEHSDERFGNITIEQLMWHGGCLMRDGRRADFWQLAEPFPDVLALRDLMLGSELIADSGSEIKYSNLGYALLGQVIEAVTASSYSEVAQRCVIEPLGLRHTFVAQNVFPVARCATGYTRHIAGNRRPVDCRVPTLAYSSVAGWHSTPSDMARFLSALYSDDNGRLLDKASKHTMIDGERHHWRPAEPSRERYGLGFMQHIVGGRTIYGHAGGFIAQRSCSYFDPKEQLGVSIMVNSNDAPVNEMATGILNTAAKLLSLSRRHTPLAHRRFNVLLENMLDAKRVLALGGCLLSAPMDSWYPLEEAEKLVWLSPTRLKTECCHFVSAPGESIDFVFDKEVLRYVAYGGVSMLPNYVSRPRYTKQANKGQI